MQTLIIQIRSQSAWKAIRTLEENHAVSIVEDADIDMESPALPGHPLTLKAFKTWVAAAEAAPSVSLKAAKSQWARQRKQLLQLTK